MGEICHVAGSTAQKGTVDITEMVCIIRSGVQFQAGESEIKHRREHPSPEINYDEIYLPDDRHFGTGIFKVVTEPGALSTGKAVISMIINVPAFQMSLNLNPATKEIPILLGFADGSDPISIKIYLFPENIDLRASHEFQATFKDWEITGLSMDGVPLGLK
jgi:hypothetical protein